MRRKLTESTSTWSAAEYAQELGPTEPKSGSHCKMGKYRGSRMNRSSGSWPNLSVVELGSRPLARGPHVRHCPAKRSMVTYPSAGKRSVLSLARSTIQFSSSLILICENGGTVMVIQHCDCNRGRIREIVSSIRQTQ